MPAHGSGGKRQTVLARVDTAYGERLEYFNVGAVTSAELAFECDFPCPEGSAEALLAEGCGGHQVRVALRVAAAEEAGCELRLALPGADENGDVLLRVWLPDADPRAVRLSVYKGARLHDMAPEPRAPFAIQNLCGSQWLGGFLPLEPLLPVLSRRRGTLSSTLHEVLTPAATITFRRDRDCVDFKGARSIAALRPDLAAATRGAREGAPRVYMAVLRGALGRLLEFSDPDHNYMAWRTAGWSTARHGLDGLNESPTLDLKQVDWGALLPGLPTDGLGGHLRAARTRFNLSRRGWVLMYTIFAGGGVPWDEAVEAELMEHAAAGLARLCAIAAGTA